MALVPVGHKPGTGWDAEWVGVIYRQGFKEAQSRYAGPTRDPGTWALVGKFKPW